MPVSALLQSSLLGRERRLCRSLRCTIDAATYLLAACLQRSTGFFYEGGAVTVEQIIDRAKQFGYNAVELMTKRPVCSPFDLDSHRAREIRRYAEAIGIELCMVYGYIELSRADALDREKELVFAKETFRLAKELGAPSVRVYAGGEHIHDGESVWQKWKWCVEGLKELVPIADSFKAAGVQPGDEVITSAYTWHLQVSQIPAQRQSSGATAMP